MRHFLGCLMSRCHAMAPSMFQFRQTSSRVNLSIDNITSNPASIRTSTFPQGSYEQRTIQRLADGLRNKNRAALAESITLVESSHPIKKLMGQVLLQTVQQEDNLNQSRLAERCRSMLDNNVSQYDTTLRIGITGPPGAGKSTFIETFGMHLVREHGLRVAVLAIDPSSSRTGGSLLGDKTRMAELSLEPDAYVRPSAARGEVGGVARNTSEAVALCETAGYDVVIVETVGVGQSEHLVADLTDCFVLIIPPASGDELQGLKRGIVENVDVVLVNKADGELATAARKIQTEYVSALKFIPRKRRCWQPHVQRCSALTGDGIDFAWRALMRYYDLMTSSGELAHERRSQRRKLMWNHIRSSLFERFGADPTTRGSLDRVTSLVDSGRIAPGIGADALLNEFFKNR